MAATIKVVDGGWFAVTGADGAFRLDDVPPGTYPIVGWIARGTEYHGTVTVKEGQHGDGAARRHRSGRHAAPLAEGRHAIRSLRMMLVATALATGCHRAPAAPPLQATAAPPDMAAPFLTVMSAMRCEECHGKIAARWRTSAHARADKTPLYVAMHAHAPDAAGCDHCHAPFAGHADPAEPATREAVTCDVCHSIAAVEPARSGGAFTLATQENVKRGPLCDAKDHYFHKMGCSPLHTEGRFCAGCHLYYRTTATGASLPVFTEYEEWRDGPAADAGLECQSCHMPAIEGGEVARGWKPRPRSHDHSLLGLDGTLRKRALKLRLAVTAAGDGAVHVTATLTNVGAGHAVPSGMPGRRIVLRAVALDAAGNEEGRAERQWGRVLADDTGRERPFYAATRVVSDHRLVRDVPAVEELDIPAPRPGTLSVAVVWRDSPAAWHDELGVDGAEETLLETKVPLPTSANRAQPRIVTLEPIR